jgi:hypothetical protein
VHRYLVVFYEIAIDYLKILKHCDKDGEDNYTTETVLQSTVLQRANPSGAFRSLI